MHGQQINPCHCLEQFAVNVRCTSRAGCPHDGFAGVFFGVGDELRHALSRERLVDLHDAVAERDARYGGKVAQEIEVETLVNGCIPRVGGRRQEQRVTICERLRYILCGDVTAGAGPVFNDELLPESLRKPLARLTVPTCPQPRRAKIRLSDARAVSGSFAPVRSARRSGVGQHPSPTPGFSDEEIS
jgi:hypothetical protein